MSSYRFKTVLKNSQKTGRTDFVITFALEQTNCN